MKMYEDGRRNLISCTVRAVFDGQFVMLQRQTETNENCLLISEGLHCQGNQPKHCSFCHIWQWEWMSDIMLDQLYSPSGDVDEYLNHTLWLSLQLCAPAPQKSVFPPHPCRSCFPHLSFPFFPLRVLPLHLRIWFVMVTGRGDRKKCLFQGENVSNVS